MSLTIEQVRAACADAGLPGAEVAPAGWLSAEHGFIARVTAAGYGADVRGNGTAKCDHEVAFRPLADALASLREWVCRRRDYHVARIAILDHALSTSEAKR